MFYDNLQAKSTSAVESQQYWYYQSNPARLFKFLKKKQKTTATF